MSGGLRARSARRLLGAAGAFPVGRAQRVPPPRRRRRPTWCARSARRFTGAAGALARARAQRAPTPLGAAGAPSSSRAQRASARRLTGAAGAPARARAARAPTPLASWLAPQAPCLVLARSARHLILLRRRRRRPDVWCVRSERATGSSTTQFKPKNQSGINPMFLLFMTFCISFRLVSAQFRNFSTYISPKSAEHPQ